MSFNVYQNGYEFNSFNCEEEVLKHIEEVLKPHENLHPVKILEGTLRTTDEKKTIKVIVYQYNTLYREVFTVEKCD